MNANKLKGHAAVLTANVIFGLNIPVTKFLLSGWMSPLGYMLSCTAVSLQYTTPVHFSLIVTLSPVVVMLLAALFLRKPISRQKVAGVALGIAGAYVMTTSRAKDDPDTNLSHPGHEVG